MSGDGEGLVATVDVLESHGATALVHLVVGTHAVVMEVDEPCALVAGDRIRLGLSVAHRFDPDTGGGSEAVGFTMLVASLLGCMGPRLKPSSRLVWHAYRGQEEVALVEGRSLGG